MLALALLCVLQLVADTSATAAGSAPIAPNALGGAAGRGTAGSVRPNVLLIYVDDLRVNDDGTEVTPSQDALRAGGVSFTQARTMYPMCGPSRNALLSGRRPDSTQTWTNTGCDVRRVLGDALVTLPQAFKAAGYTTLSLGKVRGVSTRILG